MSHPRPFFVIFLSLLTVAAPGQQPAAPAGQQTSQSRLASFNIVALDSKGRPITDLHPGDLKVEDNGKAEPITFFKSSGPAQGALAEPLKPGEYSNSAAPPLNTTVILFDLMNEGITARGTGANELIAALQHAEAPERIAFIILTRDGKFVALHDFGDAAAGAATETQPWTANIKSLLNKTLNDVINHHNGNDRDVAVLASDTFNALGKLAARMGPIPGRKTLIWVTNGVPLELRNGASVVTFLAPLQRMTSAMNQADITAYTVRQSNAGAGERLGTESAITLETLSQLTGGRAYPSDLVAQALTDSATDARATYRVGFYPTADYWNGTFHKIRVTSTRPDVRIRTLSGYDALANDVNQADDPTLLTTAAAVPTDMSEIGLRATVTPGATANTLHFQISLNAGDLPFEQTGDKFLSQISLAFLKYQEKLPAQPKSITTPLKLKVSMTREQMDQAAQKPIGFPEDVTVDSSTHAVRLVIYDRAANEYGTLTVPVNPQ